MPEKLLDAARAICVSDCISTDAQFLSAARGLPQVRVICSGLMALKAPMAVGARSAKLTKSVTFPRVTSPSHSRHLNFTVEFLRSAVLAVKSRSVVHSELDFHASEQQETKKPSNRGQEIEPHL
jgi:hypothetical protein